MNTYLLTGAAGFIGLHTARRLLRDGHRVVGIDDLNPYYDPQLKQARLTLLREFEHFEFVKLDIADAEGLGGLFTRFDFQYVIHLAAQAGVRYSLENPQQYISSNLVGFSNVLEACRHGGVKHLVYASSSSVYGANRVTPFSERHNVDHPVSLYAATKKSNELMAHSYSHLFGMPTTGLRFFTVYGPWGRPDMALFLFTKAILDGRPINLFNNGHMRRDFTYVEDVVEGMLRVVGRLPTGDEEWTESDPSRSTAPYAIYNIGSHRPIDLLDLVEVLENALGRKAIKEFKPMQSGDVKETYADVRSLKDAIGYAPPTTIETGIQNFVDWYRDYYSVPA